MFKIQNKDFSNYLEGIQIQLVRTYKGEIARTLTGVISAFPASFITVGFSIQLLGERDIISLAQQLLLTANTLTIIAVYNGTPIKGSFSCTGVEVVEVRDKAERSLRLTASIVSDGTDITKPDGSLFTIKYGGTTLVANCRFGKIYQLSSSMYKLNGADLPDKKVLVLGDTVVTT